MRAGRPAHADIVLFLCGGVLRSLTLRLFLLEDAVGDLAYTQYSHAVDEVISGRLTGEKQIEHILDGIIDFGDDLRFLELSKRLCR